MVCQRAINSEISDILFINHLQLLHLKSTWRKDHSLRVVGAAAVDPQRKNSYFARATNHVRAVEIVDISNWQITPAYLVLRVYTVLLCFLIVSVLDIHLPGLLNFRRVQLTTGKFLHISFDILLMNVPDKLMFHTFGKFSYYSTKMPSK